MKGSILVTLIILYFTLLVIGGLVFHYVETVPEEHYEDIVVQSREKIRELVNATSGQELTEEALTSIIEEILGLVDSGNFSLTNKTGTSWDIGSSMFFVATLATTIGYGNMAPVTQIGRAFCTLYAFITIPVCLVMLGGVGHSITQLFNKVDDKVKDRMDQCNNPKAEKISKSMRSLITLLLGLGLFLFLPAGAFAYMEEWTYTDSLYYVMISLMTVGLGDMVAGFGEGKYHEEEWKRIGYQLSVALWIIFGLAWLSTVIAMAQDFFQSLVDKMDEQVVSKVPNVNVGRKFSGLADKLKKKDSNANEAEEGQAVNDSLLDSQREEAAYNNAKSC